MILLSKILPLLLHILVGIPKVKNQLLCNALTAVLVVSLGVNTATLYFKNVYVMKRIFSLLPLLGSTLVKSIHNRSIGLLMIMDHCFVFWFTVWTFGSLTSLAFINPMVYIMGHSASIKLISYRARFLFTTWCPH